MRSHPSRAAHIGHEEIALIVERRRFRGRAPVARPTAPQGASSIGYVLTVQLSFDLFPFLVAGALRPGKNPGYAPRSYVWFQAWAAIRYLSLRTSKR
jgi:hypothetical protein